MSVLDPTSKHQDNLASNRDGERPSSPRPEDQCWMREALGLGRQSVGLASPNPAVGCVLVRDGAVIGRGLHEYDKLDHAEVVALKAAGSEARGSTAYVTLEPCCHKGRFVPGTDELIEAG